VHFGNSVKIGVGYQYNYHQQYTSCYCYLLVHSASLYQSFPVVYHSLAVRINHANMLQNLFIIHIFSITLSCFRSLSFIQYFFSPNHNDNIRDNNLFLRHKSLISPIHKLPCNQFVSMLIMLGVFLCCSHFLLYQTPNSYLSLYVSFKSRFGKQQSSVPS